MIEDTRAPDWDALDRPAGGVERVYFACSRPSEHAGWLLPDGRLVPARCGAPNKCQYCAYQAVKENMVVTALDAERYGFPTVGMTLTTRGPLSPERFRRGVERVFDLVRHEHPGVAYLGNVEFTTGKAKRSGGIRRMHEHLLLKGVPDQHDYDYLEDEVRHAWERETGAWIVELRQLRSAAGATAYLVAHHNKTEQRPPADWSGKRFRPSREYFGEPVPELRREARRMLRNRRLRKIAHKMIVWEELDGAPEEFVQDELRQALSEAACEAAKVRFVKLDPKGGIIPPSTDWERINGLQAA